MTFWSRWRDLFRGGRTDSTEAPWLPPGLEEPVEEVPERTVSPLAAPLHVQSGSAMVRVDNGVIVVEREGEARFERPIELVSAVHIHGWATVMSPCVAQLLAQGTPVIWRSPTGYPIGASAPLHRAGLEARRAQYAAATAPQGLAIARALVRAKIVNMRGLVRRRAALPGRACLGGLQHHAGRAETAASLDTLLGIEGAATALYFSAWPEMIPARAGELTLEGRTRRPPQDEVNALLSYAYAVLAGECLAASAAAGLDPSQGFLRRPPRARARPDGAVPARRRRAGRLDRAQSRTAEAGALPRRGACRAARRAGAQAGVGAVGAAARAEHRPGGRREPVSWRQAIGLSARRLADALKTGHPFAPMERP